MKSTRSAPLRSLPLLCLPLIGALLCVAAPAAAEPASLEAVRQALRDRTYSEAEQLSAERLRTHPEDLESHYLNALALFHQGKLSAARAQAERLVTAKPNSRWVHKARFLAAECLIRQRGFPKAVQILRAQAKRLLSAQRKREVCGVILRFADALARVPDPNDPNELDKPRPDYRKAYTLYGKALELEIDEVQRAEVLFKRAQAAERIQPQLAFRHYQEYLTAFDPTWGDAPGAEKRPTGAQRWAARERIIRAALLGGQSGQAVNLADDLLRLLRKPAGASAPAELAATTAWLQLRSYRLPRPSGQDLPAALRAIDSFLKTYPNDPGCVAAAYWRAEAQAVHRRHDDAVSAFEAFLSGKAYTAPRGPGAGKALDGLKATPQELQQRWTQTSVFRIAALRGQQARYDQAIKRYEEYTRRFPNGPQWAAAHSAIREAQFQLCLESVREKRYDEARQRFDRFLAAHPLDGRAPQVLFLLGQLRVAEAEFLIKSAPDKAKAAKSPQVAQLFKQAIAAWARLASKYPHSNEASLALYQTGVLHEERFDDLEEALKTYRRVTRGSAAGQARARIALLTREALSVLSPRVFRTDEGPTVDVEVRNLKTLSVRQYFLDLEGYFRKHHEIGGVERLDIGLIQPDATFEVKVDGFRKYAPRKQSLAIPFPKGKGGVCLVSVTGGDYEATTLVVRSDLELVFKASREELLAFAQDARLGKPAPGVKILVSDGEKVFTTGTTGKDGVLRLKHERLKNAGALRLFAQQGGMVAASGLSLSGLSSGLKLAARGYLYCDRPAYQPGQVVHAKGVVRKAGDTGYEVPSAKNYRVRLIGPRGRVLDEELAPLTRFGTFCASFTLDPAVPVGDYRVVAGPVANKGTTTTSGPAASGTFTVQQFELRPVELKLEAPRTVYRRGEVVELSASARFSWGQPLVGKRVQIRLPNGRTTVQETDDKGRCKVSFDTSGRPAGQPLVFYATLLEEGVTANLTVFMPRLGYALSVNASQPLVLAGEPVEVEVSSKGPDGKPVGRKLVLFVQRQETPTPDPVLAKVPWFGRRSRAAAARTIQTHSLETDPKTGRARLSVKLPEGGQYILRAVGEDRFQQQVVAEGRVKVSGAEDATRLRIFSPEATLKVGREHVAKVHSRLSKPTLALVTYEGDAVLEYRILKLAAGFTEVKTAVDHVHFPNFRLAVTALEKQSLHTAHKDFKVERELKVRIKPGKKRQAPGSESTVELEVTDQLGRPVQAELSLALVEETLYARYAERAEPIRDAFEKGATRRAEFRVAASNGFKYQAKTTKVLQALKDEANRLDEVSKQRDELGKLELSMAKESEAMDDSAAGESFGRRARRSKKARPMARPPGAPMQGAPMPMDEPMAQGKGYSRSAGSAGRGGGRAAPAPRKDALGSGFWKCQITTDAKGHATIKVPLPERATRWRLTARGVTVATLVGQGRSEVITAKDFFCELLAPRHVRTGDRPQLLARVHGKPGLTVKLGLDVRQGKRTLVSTRRESIVLGKGGTAEVLLPEIEVPSADALTFVLRASAGEAVDAVAKAVDVLPWGEELVAHGGGTASGNASVGLRLPPGQLRTRWLDVMVGPSLEDTLAELALTSGRGWPSSLGGRLLGLSSALRYARKTGADRATLARLEESLRQAIAAVGPRQKQRGGFGHAGANVRETCLTLWGLATARKLASFRPDTRASEVFLTNHYRATRSLSEQARILHALGEIGRGDFKLANSLYRSRNQLDPIALSQLALVFHRLNRLQIARELAGRLPALRAPSKDPLVGAWQLLALARIQPGTPAEKAQAALLLQGRGTGAGCAQPAASGLVVAALAAHLGEGQPASDDARITVLLDGKEIGVVERRGAKGATRFKVGPETLGDRREVVLSFRLEGRARYAYAATLRGFQPSYGPRTKNGFRVRDRTYRHAQLRHRGRAIGARSTSTVKNVELGQRVEVTLDLSARAPKSAGLVLIEPIPAGLSLVPKSLQGGHVYHELRDGELRLYFRPGRWVSSVRYALVGRVAGQFRVPPSRLVNERDPSSFGRGTASELRVLGPGAKSQDPYSLNDSERLALGRLFFAEGEFNDALKYITPLFERKKRPAEKELARMLLWIHTDPRHYDARMIVAAFEVLAVRYPELEVPFDKIFVVGRAYADLGEHERAMLVFRATIDASFLSDAGIGAILADQGQNLGAVDYESALWWHYPNSAQVAASLFATSQRLYQLAPQARRLAKEPRLDLPGLPAPAKRSAPTRISLLARTIRTLRAFLAHHPQSPLADDAAFSLANAFLDLKRHKDVVTLSGKSLKVYPKSDFVGSFQYMRALGHFWQRDYGQASGSAKVVAEGKTRFHRLGKYILGQIHHAQGQPKEAIDWYSKVKKDFPDAKESIDYFTRRALTLAEVTTVRPGKAVELEVKSRNLKSARLEVYKVDLMKLYLREKDLSKITKVELAGIAPQLSLDVALGSVTDYADKTTKAKLKLDAEGAYLVIARGDDLFASGLVLITPLKIEVQEDASGRLRVNLEDTVKGIRPANVHVKAVGSSDGRFKSGETDLRGVFVADGLTGKATVIAKAGDARYAFHRGEKWLGQRQKRYRNRGGSKPAPVDYDGYLRKQNRVMQEKSQQGWDQQRRRARKGVQVQQAR